MKINQWVGVDLWHWFNGSSAESNDILAEEHPSVESDADEYCTISTATHYCDTEQISIKVNKRERTSHFYVGLLPSLLYNLCSIFWVAKNNETTDAWTDWR